MDADLERIIKDFCKELGIKQYSIEGINYNKIGEGFLSDITFFTLIDEINEKEFNLVVKKAFKQPQKRSECKVRTCFLNEINAYTEVLPKFLQMQRELSFKDDILDFTFKCYLTSKEDLNEYLIFDNGKALGYKMVNKNAILDGNHLELIFRKYAQFHSLSLILEQRRPELFEEAKKSVTNLLFTIFNNPPTAKYLDNIMESAMKSLGPEDGEEIAMKMQNGFCNEKWLNTFTDFDEAKLKVLVHGDCWSNNLMFKYDDGKPVGIKLLDWQLISYRSPICDLSYCLYSGTSKDKLDQLDSYLKLYHDSLMETLQKFNYNFESNPVLSLEELKQEWKNYSKFGFVMSLIVIKLKNTSKDTTESYKGQIRNLILHMHEIDAL